MSGAFEKKTLRNILENYTFEEFVHESQEWLKSGRTLWYVSGNIAKEEALYLAERVTEILALEPVEKEDLADIRCIALPVE